MMNMLRFPAFAAALAAAFAFAACAGAQPLDPTAPDAVVEYGGPDPLVIETAEGAVTLTVEIADTPQSRQRGLMHRDSLDPDAGMLFDFGQEQVVSIWMENTRIPLDLIYIRANGTIAKIVANAQPFSRRQNWSDFPVLSVLEINGGRAAELNIEPGDLVRHRLFSNAGDNGDNGDEGPAPAPAEEADTGEGEGGDPQEG